MLCRCSWVIWKYEKTQFIDLQTFHEPGFILMSFICFSFSVFSDVFEVFAFQRNRRFPHQKEVSQIILERYRGEGDQCRRIKRSFDWSFFVNKINQFNDYSVEKKKSEHAGCFFQSK